MQRNPSLWDRRTEDGDTGGEAYGMMRAGSSNNGDDCCTGR